MIEFTKFSKGQVLKNITNENMLIISKNTRLIEEINSDSDFIESTGFRHLLEIATLPQGSHLTLEHVGFLDSQNLELAKEIAKANNHTFGDDVKQKLF